MAIGQSAQTLNANRFILDQRHHCVANGMGMGDQINLGQFIDRPLTQER